LDAGVNDNAIQSTGGGDFELVGVPTDLAERVGAVRLMRLALEGVDGAEVPIGYFKASPDQPMYGIRALLTTWTYALARGVVEPARIENGLESQPDLRYLMSDRAVDAYTLGAFFESNQGLVAAALSRLMAAVTGYSEAQIASAVAARIRRAGAGLSLAA
jgi:hypothetical protein